MHQEEVEEEIKPGGIVFLLKAFLSGLREVIAEKSPAGKWL